MGNLYKSTSLNQPVGNSTSWVWCAQQDTVPKIQLQQDSLLTKQSQLDTTVTPPEGINPLFIMIERKTAEVEAIKAKASKALRANIVPKAQPKQVDTTCYICPFGQQHTLGKVIENAEGKNLDWFTDQDLFDAEYYLTHVEVNHQVFIETQPEQNHWQPVAINIKPLHQEQNQFPWLFFPVLSLLILLVFIRAFFAKNLQEVVRSTLFFYNAKKMFWDNASMLNNLFRLLDISVYLSIPTSVIITLNTLKVNVSAKTTLYIGLYTLVGLVLLRLLRFITTRVIGLISNKRLQFKQLHLNQLLYTRVLGLVLIPLNLLALYTFESAQVSTIYLIIGITGVFSLLRFIRIVQVFLFNQFSMFYLFLYLCALEFIPLLVVFKEIFVE